MRALWVLCKPHPLFTATYGATHQCPFTASKWTSGATDITENLKAIYSLLYELPVMHGYAFRPPNVQQSGPGRPRYVITSEQLLCKSHPLFTATYGATHQCPFTASKWTSGAADITENLKAIYTLLYELPVMHDYAFRPPNEQQSGPGRPRYVITSEQLGCLRREFNSWSQIASDLVVPRQTTYNRRRELAFSLNLKRFSTI